MPWSSTCALSLDTFGICHLLHSNVGPELWACVSLVVGLSLDRLRLSWLTVRPCDAHHEWPDDRWRLAQHIVLELGDLKAGRRDRLHGWTVAVAAVAYPRLQPVESILPSRQALVFGAHVLKEQQPPARLQYPAELTRRTGLVIDGAEHERGDDHVEAVVLERQILGGGTHDRGRCWMFPQPPLQPAHHRPLGLSQGQRLDTFVEG